MNASCRLDRSRRHAARPPSQRIGDGRGWEVAKRREFQNDALIALTARRYGATVVTASRSDFEPLVRTLHVEALYA